MTDNLELLIAEMARHKADRQQCSLAAATRQIHRMVAEAREQYRAAGALYSDDDRDFCRLPARSPARDADYLMQATKMIYLVASFVVMGRRSFCLFATNPRREAQNLNAITIDTG